MARLSVGVPGCQNLQMIATVGVKGLREVRGGVAGVECSASCYSDSTHLITPSQANDSPQFNGGEERGWGGVECLASCYAYILPCSSNYRRPSRPQANYTDHCLTVIFRIQQKMPHTDCTPGQE